MHPFLLQSSPTWPRLTDPSWITPWPWTQATTPFQDPHITSCRLQRPHGSGRVSGQGDRREASRRNRRSALAGGADSGRTRGRKDAGGGDKAGGYLQTSADTAPVVAMLHLTSGFWMPSQPPWDPWPDPRSSVMAPYYLCLPQPAMAGDEATGHPRRAGWLPTSSDSVFEPPTPSQGLPEPGPRE